MRFTKLFISILVFVANHTFCNISVFVDVERGYYEYPFEVILSTNLTNASIYYTLDNSKPTINNGLIFNNKLDINSTISLKAFAANSKDTTATICHTYIFLNDVIEAAYMDTSITKSETYEPLIKESFLALPVVSISSNLIERGSIISNDVETSIEMFFANGTTAFQVNCGIETWGGSFSNLKKHYRLEFKRKYGLDELKYPLFNDFHYPIDPVKSFNRLLLRSGSQDGLNSEFGDESKALFIRTRVMMDLQMEMGYPAPHGRFVHLFINQKYEGVYDLMERPDQDFFKDYYFNEVDKSEIEVRKNDTFLQQPFYNTLYDEMIKIASTDLTIEANYKNLSSQLDLNQAASYLLLNHYGGSFDWGANWNNLGASATGYPYKFVLWDVDLTLDNEGVFEELHGDQLAYNSLQITGPVPNDIVENAEFRMLLADKIECNCYNKGSLTPQKVALTFQNRANQIGKALIAESARWGNVDFEFNGTNGHLQIENWDVDEEWITALNQTLTHFIYNRTDTLIAQYKKEGIYPQIEAVRFKNEKFILNKNDKVELLNPNTEGEIYYSINGEDPRGFGGVKSLTAILYTTPIAINAKSEIRARVLLDGKWSAMCPQTFYLNQDYSNIIINEIHYKPLDSIIHTSDTIAGKKFEFIELFNKSENEIDLHDVSIKDGIQYQFKKTSIFPPKSYLVLSSDSLLFSEKYNFSPHGVFRGNLSNEGESIVLTDPFNNTIDSIDFSPSASWVAPEKCGTSLSLTAVNLDNSIDENWKYSTSLGGTPGKINFLNTSISENDIIDSNFLKAYYNSGILTIESQKPIRNSVQIFNSNFQLIETAFFSKQELTKKVILSKLPKGIYFVIVEDNQKYFTRFFTILL